MFRKISKPRRLLGGIPVKMASFLTVQMLQHMMIIISMKKFSAICDLRLSNLWIRSGELINVRPIKAQKSLERLHSKNK